MWVSDSLGYFTDLCVSPEGSYFITSYYTQGTAVWDTKTNKLLYYINPENSNNYRASFTAISSDGKYILMAYYKDEKRYIAVYDYLNKTQIATVPCPFRITCLRFSHDGKTFAAGGYRTVTVYPNPEEKHDQVMLYDAETWKEKGLLEDSVGTGNGYTHIEYSFNDRRLGVARNLPYGVRIYDIGSKQLLSEQPEVTYCANLAFLPDTNNMLYYFFKGGLNYELGLYNGDEKKASYHICGASLITNNINDELKILTEGAYKITLLKPSSVGIQEGTSQTAEITYIEKVLYMTYDNIDSQTLTVSIYSIDGKSVYEGSIDASGNGKVRLNVELGNGIYLYKIVANSREVTGKFVVAR